MHCTHYACLIDSEGRERRYLLPGTETTLYAAGDYATSVDGKKHFQLGSAYREFYGAKMAGLRVAWDAKPIDAIPPHLTPGKD